MRGEGLKKMLDARRNAEAEAAEALAQLDDDETRDAEEIKLTKEAWLTEGSFIRVEVDEDCNFDQGKGDAWPVTCTKLDATDRALCALKRQPDFGKVMRAARQALRTLKLRRPFTPEDLGATWGASAIFAVVGYKDDGTIEGMIWAQKRLRLLQDLNWNYGSSTELRCGFDRTLKAQNCVVHVVAHVEGVDADKGEGHAFEAMVIATGLKHACQCPPPGVPPTNLRVWAPAPLEAVLANSQHELYKYAVARIPPPLIAPPSSEEMSRLTKEGLADMSADAQRRFADGQKKYREKTGVGLRGKDNYGSKNEAEQLSRLRSYSCWVHLLEARECVQLNRKPAWWAAEVLTPAVLKRVAKAGLKKDEFWTVLPTEEEKGVQGFDIEKFIDAKLDGHRGAHVSDHQIETQRGPFPTWDVAVAVKLFREDERPPKPPFKKSYAPRVVKDLIERALAWSPPASEPSPPPAKKPRSRRSARAKPDCIPQPPPI